MTLTTVFTHTFWQSLIPALLHTLWIGVLVSAMLAIALRRPSMTRANLRYALCLLSLLAILLGGVMAWAAHDRLAEMGLARGSDPTDTSSAHDTVPISTSTASGPGDMPGSNPSQGAAVSFSAPVAWESVIAVVWCLGVVLMSIRLGIALTGAHQLRMTALPIEETSPIHAMVTEIGDALALGSRVLVLASDRLQAPAVIGALRPLLLWPTVWLTGLPEWQIRAILAHELAHIRRHDFLVNVLQMLVETVLFFNPAVWWISRQIRIEREACCDALAAGLLNDQEDLAHTLTDVANRRRSPHAPQLPQVAVAFAGEQGGLLDRVRRLIEPAYQPIVRVPWLTLVVMLTLAGLVLAGLKKTGDMVAQAVMQDEQRIERMTELQETFGQNDIEEREYGEADKVNLVFRVQTHDRKPLPKDIHLNVRYQRPRFGGTSGYSLHGSQFVSFSDDRMLCSFENRVEFGKTRITITAPGYAPFFSDALLPEPGGVADFGVITLQSGFSARILIQDKAGNVLEAVDVRGSYEGPPNAGFLSKRSDRDGLVTFTHASGHTLSLEAIKEGYARARKRFTLTPGYTHPWVLEPAKIASGRVVDATTGGPIEGGRILMIGEDTNGHFRSHSHESEASRLAVTGAGGHFDLANLNAKGRYALVAMAEGYCPGIVKDISAGQQDILFRLDKAIVVRGKVINIPEDQLNRKGKVGVYFRHRIQISESFRDIVRPQKPLWLEPANGRVSFQLDSAWSLPLEIDTAGVGIRIDKPKSADDLVIDVAELQARRDRESAKAQASVESLSEREVIIHLKTPRGSSAPQGALTVEHIRYESNSHWEGGMARISHTRQIPVDAQGAVRFTLKMPNHLELSPTGLKGFTFDPQWYLDGEHRRSRVDIEPASEPFETTVALKPAGSIYGQVLELDGSAAHSLLISVLPSEGIDIKTSAGGEDDTHNRFHAGPLPLDKTYRIVAHRGYSYLVSDPVTLTPDRPFQEIEMQFPETHDLEVEVVDASGRPVADMPVGLSFSCTLGHGFGHDSPPRTDRRGVVRFEGVIQQKDEEGTYTLKLDPSGDYQPQLHGFSQFTPGDCIRLVAQRGIVMTGQLVDTVTGRPMPEARVYAMPGWDKWYEDKTRYNSYIDADSVTDEQGRFRFSRLGKGPYRLGTSHGREMGDWEVSPGDVHNIELRAKASDRFREKHFKE